jgi:hypothetical protein
MTAGQHSRRARNALLWGLAAFASLQLGSTAALEYGLIRFRDPSYAFKATRLRGRVRDADRRAGGHEARRPQVVVMLGSSLTRDGLRGSVVEDGLSRQLGRPVILYNFGTAGDGPIHELLHFERLLHDGVRPDLLLIEVLPSLLTVQAETQLELIAAERMGFRDRALLARYGVPLRQLRRYSWRCWATPLYAHRMEILSILLPKFVPLWLRQDLARRCDDSGWMPPLYDLSPEGRWRAREGTRLSYGPLLRPYRVGGPFADSLRRLTQRCRQERIPTALVLMPEGTFFRGLYAPDAWDRVLAFLEELGGPSALPVVNARDWAADEQFFDSHHLLPAGAAAFTERLSRQVLLPLLRRQAGQR